MKTQISNSGVFSRQVSLEPVAALPGQFSLQFASVLGNAKDPKAEQRNFQAILDLDDVLALRDLFGSVSPS